MKKSKNIFVAKEDNSIFVKGHIYWCYKDIVVDLTEHNLDDKHLTETQLRIKFVPNYLDKRVNKVMLTSGLVIVGLFLLAIAYKVTTSLSFREETYSFENVPFEWDDDFDRYDVCITEEDTDPYGDYAPGYLTQFHYYVPSSKAHLIYSEDEWSCFGVIKTYWNAYGKMLDQKITDFYINVNYKEDIT